MLLSSIPSPTQGTWQLGPFPIRAYAMCIILGIVVAVWWSRKRWAARGGDPTAIDDIAVWAVPAGIIGGRLYHVATDWQLYFGPDGRGALAALRIWDGGLGIWGAIALGFAAAAWHAKRKGWSIAALADAVAPGIIVAQAIGRFGNWFNQELFGAPTDLPWGLEISVGNRPEGYAQFPTFHPTFLYEAVWAVGVAFALVWLERRWRATQGERYVNGQVFAAYVALYSLGRAWVEHLRIDSAHVFFGLRLNEFTAVLLVGLALCWLIRARRRAGLPAGGLLS